MIPILYAANETEFTTLGIGPLADAIKCVVTEELNGEYELEMTYPVSGVHYSELVEDRLIYAVPFEGGNKQIFKIYQIEKPLNGEVIVRAEHIHYLLNKMVVMPFSATSAAEAMVKLKSNIVDSCPFTFSTDKTTTASFKMVVPVECGKVLGGTEGSILDVYGPGDYEFNNFSVILRAKRGNDNGVTVRYGKNMTELNTSVDTTNVYTGIIPYYRDSEDNVTYASGYAVWSDHKSDYVYPMAKVVDMSSWFDEEKEIWEEEHPDEVYTPPSNDLIEKANEYLTRNAGWDKSTNIKVSFVNLWQSDEYADLAILERVKMGDTVKVVYQKLGVSATKRVIKTEYNVLLDRYDSIELGTALTSLTTEVANTSAAIERANTESMSMMQKAIEHATKLITGGLGGYVVINTNASGNPNEILIMDTPKKETAVNVWRFNLNGLGHSHSGYNGPFDDVALTQDGRINANMITTGVLNANIIKAGILADENSLNYWNLATGEFKLSANTTVGGSTVSSIANSAASSAVSSYDTQLNQTAVFNKLTRNGAAQGIYMTNGNLYINAAYIASGTMTANRVRAGLLTDEQGYNYWNLSTGEFSLSANTTVGGSTVSSIANSAASSAVSAYDTQLNQTAVFNKLTRNGAAQGIYMQNGNLYINAAYIATGILADRSGNTSWNLSTGALSSKKFSVQSTNFTLTEAGHITATGAEFEDVTITSSATSGSGVNISSSEITFDYNNSQIATLAGGHFDYYDSSGTLQWVDGATLDSSDSIAINASDMVIISGDGIVLRDTSYAEVQGAHFGVATNEFVIGFRTDFYIQIDSFSSRKGIDQFVIFTDANGNTHELLFDKGVLTDYQSY